MVRFKRAFHSDFAQPARHAAHDFVNRAVQLGRRGCMRRGRRQEYQIATEQIVAPRVQTITLAQTAPRAIAPVGFGLFLWHHKRRASFVRIVSAPMRFERKQGMPHALAVGKCVIELGAFEAIGAGQHGLSSCSGVTAIYHV